MPLVCPETAQSAKFADAIHEALRRDPARPQRFEAIQPGADVVKRYIEAQAG